MRCECGERLRLTVIVDGERIYECSKRGVPIKRMGTFIGRFASHTLDHGDRCYGENGRRVQLVKRRKEWVLREVS